MVLAALSLLVLSPAALALVLSSLVVACRQESHLFRCVERSR
jgi:hypothetical protein